MTGQKLEEFLARLYVDPSLRAKFRADPMVEARNAGLTVEECQAIRNIDWNGLELAARSFARKRAVKDKLKSSGALRMTAARIGAVLMTYLRGFVSASEAAPKDPRR